MNEASLIDAFQQSRTERSVNLDGCRDHESTQFVGMWKEAVHGDRSTESRDEVEQKNQNETKGKCLDGLSSPHAELRSQGGQQRQRLADVLLLLHRIVRDLALDG